VKLSGGRIEEATIKAAIQHSDGTHKRGGSGLRSPKHVRQYGLFKILGLLLLLFLKIVGLLPVLFNAQIDFPSNESNDNEFQEQISRFYPSVMSD